MNNKKTVGWIARRFYGFSFSILLITLLSAITSVSSVGLIWLSKLILDDAQHKVTGQALTKHIVLLIALLVFQISVNAFNNFYRTRTSNRMDIHLKEYMFRTLVVKDYSILSHIHSGDIVNRLSSDVDTVVSGIAVDLPYAISLLVSLIAGVIAVFALDPLVATLILCLGFFFPFFGRMISKKYKFLHREVQRTTGVANSFLQECMQNIIIIKSFFANNPVNLKLSSYLKDNYKVKIKRSLLSTVINTGLNLSFSLTYYGVLAWGAVSIALGSITYGTLMAFLQLVSQLRGPLQNISGLLPKYYAALSSAERLIELENIKNEDIPVAPVDALKLYEKLNSISARGLSFQYDKADRYIVENADFDIEKGKVYGLVGESGIGKSTVMRLLLGLYNPEGELYLDTTDGKIPLTAAYRTLFSYVPQGAFILSGTIRENIAFLNSKISDEEIMEAARKAVIDELIRTAPNGLDTVLGERGIGLSEGQIQRISIARALLFDSPILLLDECTSALDGETEIKLLNNLKKESGKTVLLITHREKTLDYCDSVLRIQNKSVSK